MSQANAMRPTDDVWAGLEPELSDLERRRKAAVKRALLIGSALLPVAAVAGGVAFALGMPPAAAGFLAVTSVLLGLALAYNRVHKIREQAKQQVASRVAEAFGLDYTLKPGRPIWLDRITPHGLLPSGYDTDRYEDGLSGRFHGAAFSMIEAHLTRRRKGSDDAPEDITLFRGALIRIAFPRKVEGLTVIARDRGALNLFQRQARESASNGGLSRVGLADPKFEDVFEVYGEDQVMARYLVTPSFMERLLDLESALQGENVRAMFAPASDDDSGGELFIAAETGNRFELDPRRNLAQRSLVDDMHADVSQIERIVAIVMSPPENASPAP